ncbi:uncharacterized protein BX663DRAFT_526640 [Cokeromyces recurvatus]|uniref:uncharacterized protein n=1 Tax=Cokeromyces recurvatus TaxID=90255 RepID=UPI00221FDCB2|nr:uncharacterized protein BX663DRAFT_526640 [Cokeromyces recurvatus]KAI7897973.1 hypothetical protein BX663DRAFT_526640 [Cokeromyces recurvatus]
MTLLSVSPINSCLVQASHKRKRIHGLHVRFCTQPQDIIYTYSQTDYDRSGLYSNIDEQDRKEKFTRAISIFCEQEILFQMMTSQKQQPIIKNIKKSNKIRPNLVINTNNLQDPLYFTNLTTDYQKHTQSYYRSKVNDLEEEIGVITR